MIRYWLQGIVLIALAISNTLYATTTMDIKTVELTDNQRIDISFQLSLHQASTGKLPESKDYIDYWLTTLSNESDEILRNGRYAAAINIENNANHRDWFVHLHGTIVETVHIAAINSEGRVVKTTGYNHEPRLAFDYKHSFQFDSEETTTLIFLFESDYYIAPARIALVPDSAGIDTQGIKIESITIILCLGICLALGIYNFFLFIGSREKTYLFYSLSTLSFMFAWANVFGLWQHFGFNTVEYLLIPPFLIGAAFNMYFAIHFLELEQRSPTMYYVIMGCAWLAIILLPISSISPNLGFFAATFSSTLSLILGLIVGIRSWMEGYRPARYFTLAFVAVALPNLIANILNMGIFDSTVANTYVFALVGVTLDALLLAFALADRVSIMSKEHNFMAETLENKVYERTEALAEANVALEHLISELQEASSSKNHFLANMSHEIRTPLTSIIGYADSILMGDIDSKEQHRVIRIISENGNHLLHIINDILDISKIEADKLEFEMLPSSIFDVVSQVESVMAKRARDKNLDFGLEYEFPIPSEVFTDPTRFRQILFNLTNNAIKFTHYGSINIHIKYVVDKLVVSVKDTGIGMDREKVKSVFNPFEQGESSTTRKFGGTGLGLSISKRLAVGLGGDIKVSSELGAGSTFEVSISAKATIDSTMIKSLDQVWPVDAPMQSNDGELPDFSGSKVLLVDDHPHNRDLIGILLKRMNLIVEMAADGEQALQKVFTQDYDLVLMDIQMPIMSGDEATVKLREYGYELPIIALTANNMKHEIEMYMQKGFTNHLAKPIVRHDFVNTLAHYLTSKGSKEDLFENDEMYPLVADYHKDLGEQISLIQKAWDENDIEEFIEITHRLKGAAGSFGFMELGEKCAALEGAAKSQELDKIKELLPDFMRYAKRCSHLPGVDIPKGITNHDVSIELFHENLELFLSTSTSDLTELQSQIENGPASVAMLHLNRMLPRAKRIAWLKGVEYLEQLEANLKSDNSANNAELIYALRESANELKSAFLN